MRMPTLRKKIAVRQLEMEDDLTTGSASQPLSPVTTSPSPRTLERWYKSSSPINFETCQMKTNQLSVGVMTDQKFQTMMAIAKLWHAQHDISEHGLQLINIQNHVKVLSLTFENECTESKQDSPIPVIQSPLNGLSAFKFSSSKTSIHEELAHLVDMLTTIKTLLEKLDPQDFQLTIINIQQVLTKIQPTVSSH